MQCREETLTPTELAWVAGLLEGEGCFSIHKTTDRGKLYEYPIVMCLMTDLDVIQQLQRVTGIGRVGGPYGRSSRDGRPRKPQWRWAVQSKDQAAALMQHLLPHMGSRRQHRIRQVLLKTGYLVCR